MIIEKNKGEDRLIRKKKKNDKEEYGYYWQRMLGYKYSRELAIYKSVCGQKLKKEDRLKVHTGKRYKTYTKWEEYVRILYNNAPLAELEEFYKYLNYKKRADSTADILTLNLLPPLVISMISVWLLPAIDKIPENNLELAGKELSSVLVAIGVDFFLFMLCFAVLIGSIVCLTIMMAKEVVRSKQIVAFYEDYMKIIAEIIKEKE